MNTLLDISVKTQKGLRDFRQIYTYSRLKALDQYYLIAALHINELFKIK